MPFDTSQANDAWEGLVKSCLADRLGHAYIIEGAPRGIGRVFAEQMVQLFLCRDEKPPC